MDRYDYRRALGIRDLLPAIGAGLVAGIAVFYVTAVLRQRTPLGVPRVEPRRTKRLPSTKPTGG